jgi:YidC/Oxa1 family membrane protein insertase
VKAPPQVELGIEGAFTYPALTIPPQSALEQTFTLYAGPKEYKRLAGIATQFQNNVDLVMDFGFMGFFSKILLLTMNWLHGLGLNYGLAIVVMTILIKLLFWPLTNASTKSMKRMAALQPQMQALQEKYKDDPQKKNQKLWEFMKENKVNPMGGCIPLLLQMPVFFGLIGMLRTSIELRGAQFLWVCHAGHDGLADAPDSRLARHGSHAAAHHEVHPGGSHGDFLQFFRRFDALLGGAESSIYSSDQDHPSV